MPLVLCCLVSQGLLYGQGDESAESQIGRFHALAAEMSQEAVYLHTDRQTFFSGDSIWFQLYVVDQRLRQPSAWSRIAWLDLLDAAGKSIAQASIALEKGQGGGTLSIPHTAETGPYFLCAYTRWMRNAGPENLSFHEIGVIHPEQGVPEPAAKGPAAMHINFFPDGGQLVADLDNHVAFLITGPDSPSGSWEGHIADDQGKEICQANATGGRGEFSFQPEAGKSYFWVPADTTSPRIALPPVQPQGMTLRISPVSDGFEVIVLVALPEVKVLHLVAHAGGRISENLQADVGEGAAAFHLPASQLAGGLNFLTFLSDAGEVLAERRIYNPAPSLHVQMEVQGERFGKRQEVVVDLRVSDAQGQPVQATFSVSAGSEDPLQRQPRSLQQQMALPAAGSPDFSDPVQTDLWLRTHPHRGIRWTRLLTSAARAPAYLPELYAPVFSGRVVNPESGEGLQDAWVYLAVPGKTARIDITKSGPEGEFLLFVPENAAGDDLVVRSERISGKASRVELFLLPELTAADLPAPLPWPEDAKTRLQSAFLHRQIANAYTLFTPADTFPHADYHPFYGKADVVYPLDEFTRFTTEETFVEIAYLVSLQKKQGQNRLRVYDQYSDLLFKDSPLMLVDGIPVSDANEIISLKPRQLERLEVVNTQYYKGPAVFDGILHAVTYVGDGQTITPGENMVRIPYAFPGQTPPFRAPAYPSQNSETGHFPDFRELLHWAPEVRTDEQGRAQIRFYTSDAAGRYLIRAEGMAATGQAGSAAIWILVGEGEN